MNINNRKAKHDYEILKTYEAGVILQGPEVKSIRNGDTNLKDSYCYIENGEMFVRNWHVKKYEYYRGKDLDPTRVRKLLLNKNEIKQIEKQVTIKGNTIVPLKLYLVRGKIKLQIGVARGKKNYDKRQSIKERDIKRDQERYDTN